MSTLTRKLSIMGAAALVSLGVVVGLDDAPADAAPPPCTVGVMIFEDGSWGGTSVWMGKRKVADGWRVADYRSPDVTVVTDDGMRVRYMGGFPADLGVGGPVCAVRITR